MLKEMGVFKRLNTITKIANDMMCTDKCPCQFKIVLGEDFDTSYLLDDLIGGRRSLESEPMFTSEWEEKPVTTPEPPKEELQ